MDHFKQILNHLWSDGRETLKCHTFICAALFALSLKAFWVIQIVSAEGCSSLMQKLMQIHCSTCSVSLKAIATQDTCSLNCLYCPHWLVQWSLHYSHMHIPVHSPWLPGSIDVTQTVLIILTTARLFPDTQYQSTQYMKQTMTELRGEIHNTTTIRIGDFNNE